MSRLNKWVVLLFAVALWLPAHDAAAQAEPAGAGPDLGSNVRITILVGKVLDDGSVGEREYRLVGREGGPRSEILMGWRTPIPSTHEDADANAKVTSYVYQNVGVSANIEFRAVSPGRFALLGLLEVSGVRESEADVGDSVAPPRIGTYQQQLSVVLEEGKALRVAEMPDPDGGQLYVDLKAETLK